MDHIPTLFFFNCLKCKLLYVYCNITSSSCLYTVKIFITYKVNPLNHKLIMINWQPLAVELTRNSTILKINQSDRYALSTHQVCSLCGRSWPSPRPARSSGTTPGPSCPWSRPAAPGKRQGRVSQAAPLSDPERPQVGRMVSPGAAHQ